MRFILLLVALVYVIRSTEAAFTFVLQVNNHTTSGSCIPRLPVFPSCDTYFSPFCLRESRINRSTNLGDCPLGAYRERRNGTISIQSSAEWKVKSCILSRPLFYDQIGAATPDKKATSVINAVPKFQILLAKEECKELSMTQEYYNWSCPKNA